MWTSEGDDANLHCDTCPTEFLSRGTRRSTQLSARAAHWGAWDGAQVGGGHLHAAQCPNCRRVPRPRVAPQIEGQEALEISG